MENTNLLPIKPINDTEGRVKLELLWHSDGMYLNFWDFMNGNDVICEVKQDPETGELKLYRKNDLDETKQSEGYNFPTNLTEFIQKVKGMVDNWEE